MAAQLSNAQLKAAARGPHKFRAVRTVCGHGHRHDSKKEGARCDDLHLLLAGGEIDYLSVQHRFALEVNGVKVTAYVADFRYQDARTERWIVEDVKGCRTNLYRLKKKLMRACLGIEIHET